MITDDQIIALAKNGFRMRLIDNKNVKGITIIFESQPKPSEICSIFEIITDVKDDLNMTGPIGPDKEYWITIYF